MPPEYFPLRWESTGDQWWYASPIDWAAANGHYDVVRELLHLDTNLLIKLTSLRRIRRLETVWDDDTQFAGAAKCRARIARNLLSECETKGGQNSLIRAGYGGWLLYTATSAGDASFVSELLERDPFLVFGEGEYGVTDILYAAARSRNSEVFRLLLNFSFKIGGKPEEVPSTVFGWEMMNRAVHAAARGGNVEMLRELLGDCSDVLAYRDAQGSTILHTASSRGQLEVVKDLLASYDMTTSTDNQGNTALNMAAYRGHLAVVEALISASPSCISLTNNYGDTFLHMAVAGFRSPGFRRLDLQIELMKWLASGKIVNIEDVINIRNNDGRTALHLAVAENIQSEVVELLMTVRYINLNIRDANGMTPLDLLKQRPKSASSEILIKRLISAGGITNSRDYMTRIALASHLKSQSIGGSPGASFRIPDAEILFYAGFDDASDAAYNPCSAELSAYSGELSHCDSAAESNSLGNRKSGSVNNAARRLKILLRWPMRKEKDADALGSLNFLDDESLGLIETGRKPEFSPTSLRQRFAKQSSLPNSKRILAIENDLPSPLSRKRYAAGLMHGVIRAMPHLAIESPSRPLSQSCMSSPRSINRQNSMDMGNEIEEISSSNRLQGVNRKVQKQTRSSNQRLMNQYFCFGAQSLAVEKSVSGSGPNPSHKRSSSLAA